MKVRDFEDSLPPSEEKQDDWSRRKVRALGIVALYTLEYWEAYQNKHE